MQTVETQQDEQSIRAEVVQRCHAALNSSNWEVGKQAFIWKQDTSGTDADLGEQIGLTKDQVRQRRNVWERFGAAYSGTRLTWTHCREALNWDDAEECLKWAIDTEAKVHEMRSWRRAKNGEPLTPEPSKAPTQQAAEPDSPIVVPQETGPYSDPQEQWTTTETPESQKAHTPTKPRPATKPEPTPDLKAGSKTAIQSLRQLAKQASQSDRCSVAQSLRRLADELDPPTKRQKFRPPTLNEVRQYFTEQGTTVNPEEFYAFYEANGWKQSNGNAIKSWKWCLVTWENREKQTRGTGSTRVRDKDLTKPVVYRDFD